MACAVDPVSCSVRSVLEVIQEKIDAGAAVITLRVYSGANKYLIHCRFFKFSHLILMERSVIFIIGTPQL